MTRAEMMDRVRAGRDKLAREIEEMENDAAAWNRLHPGEQPLDVEEFVAEPRRLLAGLNRTLAAG